MAYKSSNAYDFDLFLPKEKETRAPRKNNVVAMPQPVKKPQSRISPYRGIACACAVSALIIGLLSYQIFLRVEISETQDSVKAMEYELQQMNSEYTRMSMQLESKMSFKSVEEAAKALGMTKKDQAAVEYIMVDEEDKVEINGKSAE